MLNYHKKTKKFEKNVEIVYNLRDGIFFYGEKDEKKIFCYIYNFSN